MMGNLKVDLGMFLLVLVLVVCAVILVTCAYSYRRPLICVTYRWNGSEFVMKYGCLKVGADVAGPVNNNGRSTATATEEINYPPTDTPEIPIPYPSPDTPSPYPTQETPIPYPMELQHDRR